MRASIYFAFVSVLLLPVYIALLCKVSLISSVQEITSAALAVLLRCGYKPWVSDRSPALAVSVVHSGNAKARHTDGHT